MGTDCTKCGTPMRPPKPFTGIFAGATFVVTAFRCQKCGHYNNLKRRKANRPTRQPNQENTQ